MISRASLKRAITKQFRNNSEIYVCRKGVTYIHIPCRLFFCLQQLSLKRRSRLTSSIYKSSPVHTVILVNKFPCAFTPVWFTPLFKNVSKWSSWWQGLVYTTLWISSSSFFGAPKNTWCFYNITLSGCDGGDRTRNIALFTWSFSPLSYNRHRHRGFLLNENVFLSDF